MDTLKEQYGYTDPADGSESSSADDSDEAGSNSKTKKASKKWQNKKFQSLMSWRKRGGGPQQTLTKITLRPAIERSALPSTAGRPAQGKEAVSAVGRAAQSLGLAPPRSPVAGRSAGLSPPASTPRRLTLPGGRPGSARPGPGGEDHQSPTRSPLLVPPPSRPRSLSLQPDDTLRCPSHTVSRLTTSTQRLSLRLHVGPQRPLAVGRGQLPNSPLRSGHPAVRVSRSPEATAAAIPGVTCDVTAPQATDGDVTTRDVTSQEVPALKVPATSETLPKRGGTSEGTTKKKKTKVKKGRKLKLKPKASK